MSTQEVNSIFGATQKEEQQETAKRQHDALLGWAGVPLKPMLAKICEGIPEALRQLAHAPFLAEHKYDGQRAQVHPSILLCVMHEVHHCPQACSLAE